MAVLLLLAAVMELFTVGPVVTSLLMESFGTSVVLTSCMLSKQELNVSTVIISH